MFFGSNSLNLAKHPFDFIYGYLKNSKLETPLHIQILVIT